MCLWVLKTCNNCYNVWASVGHSPQIAEDIDFEGAGNGRQPEDCRNRGMSEAVSYGSSRYWSKNSITRGKNDSKPG